ncbi:hypothetical protein IV203_026050 [Nitzschia inconspicua]|uniref:Uncharacterized protein n=1 Tax=Nitzschia inconspicua TaxID=303405 RepID=A0A9K3LHX6_9STRA|nr:hypothetical protein IV203_009451 [Nitzschia inconspicua]KAG7362690.1 hypothetical protein IV203_026050 [Nitzschia inconspicua]
MSSTGEDDKSVMSDSSNQTSSTSSTAAVATPNRKYRMNSATTNDESNECIVKTVPGTLSSSGASVASSLLSAAGGNLLEQKKLRKRMALMKLEQKQNHCGGFSSITKAPAGRSFHQAQDDKELLIQAKRANPNSSFHLESSEEQHDSVSKGRVSELRRRRLYEMHHNRPYSSHSKPKKKFKFWEQEKPSPLQFGSQHVVTASKSPAVLMKSPHSNFTKPRRVSSFSDYQDLSTPEARRHYREVTFQDDNNVMMEHSFRGLSSSSFDFDSSWIHPSSGGKLYTTVNDLIGGDDDDDEEPSDIPLLTSPRRALWNEQASALQAQMKNLVLQPKNDEDKDEIMDGLVYDSDEIMTPVKDRQYMSLPLTATKAENTFPTTTNLAALVSPDASSLISPLNAAVSFETPEKVTVPITVSTSEIEAFAGCNGRPNFQDVDETVFPPNAPKKERIHKTPTICAKGAPATVDATTVVSPTDVIPVDERDEAMGIQPMAAIKLSVSPVTGAIQWQSLRRDNNGEFSVANGTNSTRIASMGEVTTTIQALAQQNLDPMGENGNLSMLKLFVDMYQQSTYEEIVQHIPEIKDQGTLVICRGFDFSASTYNSNAEIKSLLAALKNVEKLDSIMLLNFRPKSMVDLAKILNQHPFMFRLHLHLAEGTLNGELLGVLTTAPRLTHVQLDLQESCAIGTLMNSKSIQSLRITSKKTELAKSHVRTLIYGLGSNHTLATLDLAPEMSIEHFRSLCSALKENRRLECLRVSLALASEEDSQVAAIELASLLKVNRSLVTVWNHLSEGSLPPNHVGKRVLQEAFRKNSIIKEVKLYQEDPDESVVSMEKHEEHILGIQPRQRHVVFSNVDEPSAIEEMLSEGDSYSREGDWLVDPKFCDDMFNSISNACSDCMIPDIGDILCGYTGASSSKKKKGGSSVSVL